MLLAIGQDSWILLSICHPEWLRKSKVAQDLGGTMGKCKRTTIPKSNASQQFFFLSEVISSWQWHIAEKYLSHFVSTLKNLVRHLSANGGSRGRYWSRMIACCVLSFPKIKFVKQNESFFIQNKVSTVNLEKRVSGELQDLPALKEPR